MKLPFYVCTGMKTHDDVLCEDMWEVPWYNPFSGWHAWVPKSRPFYMTGGAYTPCEKCMNKDGRWRIYVKDIEGYRFRMMVYHRSFPLLERKGKGYTIQGPAEWYFDDLIFDTKKKMAYHWNSLAWNDLVKSMKKQDCIGDGSNEL